MNFKELLLLAKTGEAFAINKILEMHCCQLKPKHSDKNFKKDLTKSGNE